jgi:alpha-1,2-mannosyltransferase
VNRLLESRKAQKAALGLLIAVTIILVIQMYRCAYRPQGYDFTSYIASSRALLNGSNPYDTGSPFPYIYPLFLAFILIPLAVVPYWLSNFVWFAASFASLFLSSLVLLRIAESEVKTKLGWHIAVSGTLTLLLLGSPIQNNMGNGQVNLVVVACCVIFLHYFTRERRLLSAAWLAAAISLKLLPATLLMFVLLRKEWRVALYASGLTVVFCLLPFVVVGTRLFEF